jgi:hypothetical protein
VHRRPQAARRRRLRRGLGRHRLGPARPARGVDRRPRPRPRARRRGALDGHRPADRVGLAHKGRIEVGATPTWCGSRPTRSSPSTSPAAPPQPGLGVRRPPAGRRGPRDLAARRTRRRRRRAARTTAEERRAMSYSRAEGRAAAADRAHHRPGAVHRGVRRDPGAHQSDITASTCRWTQIGCGCWPAAVRVRRDVQPVRRRGLRPAAARPPERTRPQAVLFVVDGRWRSPSRWVEHAPGGTRSCRPARLDLHNQGSDRVVPLDPQEAYHRVEGSTYRRRSTHERDVTGDDAGTDGSGRRRGSSTSTTCATTCTSTIVSFKARRDRSRSRRRT